MIKVNTIPNVAYAVSCPGACRVTAPAADGGELLLLEFDDGGGQGRFVAPGNLVWLSNAEAVVVGVALQAQDSAAAAVASAQAARDSAVQAADSAASTAESADMAAKSAEDAAGSASAASGSAEAASASATAAEGSAGAAASSAQAASGSAAAAAEHARSATDAESTAADAATDARNAATAAAASAAAAATSALSATGLPLSYHLSRLASNSDEWEAIATRMAGCMKDGDNVEKQKDRLLKIRQGALCYPQYTTTGNWIFGQAWYGDSNANFETTTWEIVIDASSITTAGVFLFDCLTASFRRVFIFAPNMTQNNGASMARMPWTHELDGVFTKLTTSGDMFANKTRTHIMPWCAGKTIESLININNFMKNNTALPADQFPIGLPNVTNAQDAFLNCPLLTQEVADAILNSLPAVEAGSNGKGTITFTGTAAATAWGAEGADLTAVNAATGKGWTVEY